MGAARRARRLVTVGGAVLAVCAASVAVAPLALATDELRVTFAAVTVTGADVAIDYQVNRPSGAIAKRVCKLKTGTTTVSTDCGLLPVSSRPAKVSVEFSGLAGGDYSYLVKVTDRDGRTASKRAWFHVDGSRSACASVGGTYDGNSDSDWFCSGVPASTEDQANQVIAFLRGFCFLPNGALGDAYFTGVDFNFNFVCVYE